MADPTLPSDGPECRVDDAFYATFPALSDAAARDLIRRAVGARSFEIEAILEDEERSDEEALEDIVDVVRDTLLLQAVGKLRLTPDGRVEATRPVGPAPADAALEKIYDRIDAVEGEILDAVDELVGED